MIEYNIRQILAARVRAKYQSQLADYMNGLKAAADIQITPLNSFASAD
jgi:hypothetical protein